MSPYSKRLRTRGIRPEYVDDSDETDDEESGEEESQAEEHGTEVSEVGALTALTEGLHLGGPQTPNNPNRPSFVVAPHTPVSRAFSSPAEDEAVVNTGFVLFLQGLCIWHPELCVPDDDVPEWTMKRLELVFTTTKTHDGKSSSTEIQQQMKPKEKDTSGQSRIVKRKKAWKARTDGFLRVGTKAVIIIEVKPFLRDSDRFGIQKQEAAQMAAWIKACPGDHHECEEGDRKIYR